jgi:hypothetical protein
MEENLKRKIEKVTKNNGDVSLAQLESTIELMDKLDEVTQAIESIPETVIPETIIPEQKEVVFPDVQKVEIINHKEDKDDTEIKNLLKDLVAEVKKKEDYAYDIEIDPILKEQLKGDTGEKGKDGVDGKDGTEIQPFEIVNKLESLEGDDRLDVSAIRGTEAFVEGIAKKIAKEEVKKVKKTTIISGGGSSSGASGLSDSFESVSANLSAYDNTLSYDVDGNITSIVYSNGVTKTFNYTGTDITSIVLSGSTPSGIELTKTLTYTDGDVTGITYS